MDEMWAFLENAEAEPDMLEDAVKSLTGLAKAKSFSKGMQGQLDALPLIKWQILVEASRLVLDPRWGQIKELLKGNEIRICEPTASSPNN